MLPTALFLASWRHGSIWNVLGSGMAIMSSSLCRMNPSMDEPSKTSPSFRASSNSSTVMEKLFRNPSISVNHNWMIFTLCSWAVWRT